jgi:hypothetical protein
MLLTIRSKLPGADIPPIIIVGVGAMPDIPKAIKPAVKVVDLLVILA